MGLIFKKYVENAYCPKCEKRYTTRVTMSTRYYCPDCHVALAGASEYPSHQYPNDFKHYYQLLSTNIKIPETSNLAFILIYVPYVILGFIGLIPFFLFLLVTAFELPSNVFQIIEKSFLMIYGVSSYRIPSSGAHSILSRIFENDFIVYGIIILSIYFSIRFIYCTFILFYEIRHKKEGG